MNEASIDLSALLEGWDGYETALERAIEPRAPAELTWRAAPGLRSAGELAGHIALGRLGWFLRMDAPGSRDLAEGASSWATDEQRNLPGAEAARSGPELAEWLRRSWAMVARTLKEWRAQDLWQTYRQPYGGKVYAVSRQWTLFRILCHDMHHGGQISEILMAQGIEIPELGDLGGHLTEPPLAADPQ